MPVFKDQDNKTYELPPEGDYAFEVVECESGIQTGNGKTAGSPYWELKLELSVRNGKAPIWERLIDHPSCDWKIDTFMKCTGANTEIKKGEPFEFDLHAAESSGAKWIDPIGLRGWLAVVHEDYTPKNGGKPGKRARVGVFYTDRAKLPRAQKAKPASKPAPSETTPEFDPLSDDVPF